MHGKSKVVAPKDRAISIYQGLSYSSFAGIAHPPPAFVDNIGRAAHCTVQASTKYIVLLVLVNCIHQQSITHDKKSKMSEEEKVESAGEEEEEEVTDLTNR